MTETRLALEILVSAQMGKYSWENHDIDLAKAAQLQAAYTRMFCKLGHPIQRG